MESGMISGG